MATVKILLVQWSKEAAASRAERLRSAGFEVLCESQDGAEAYRTARRDRPEVVVLDLDQKPAHSWQTARPLAKLANPPRLVFVGGTDDARQQAARQAPGATFIADEELERGLL
jgi:AmiR/NasT family two-component response regulator